jgi:hypothetical protein
MRVYAFLTLIIAASYFTVQAACDVPAPNSSTVIPPTVAPISYFEDRCARCHGPQGSFYGDAFGKNLTEEALRKVVYDMCRNQGEMKLEGVDLDAQIAYHRSMISKEPFLVVTHREKGQLAGEASEKAVVTVRFKRSSVRAEVKGTVWRVAVPKGEKPENAVLTAKLVERSTTIRLVNEAFSHGKPNGPVAADRPIGSSF